MGVWCEANSFLSATKGRLNRDSHEEILHSQCLGKHRYSELLIHQRKNV